MSTTTKEEKPSLLDDLKAQAAALAAKIKEETDKHLQTLHAKLEELHKQVSNVTAEIRNYSGKPVPVKRGRKAKGGATVGNGKPARAPKKAKGKRGAVGEAITAFVSSKGKAGAHVKEIAAATGYKVPNITAFFYAKANKTKFKNLGKATFALKK